MEIKQTSYFEFKVKPIEFDIEKRPFYSNKISLKSNKIPLKSNNIEVLLERLESGENLFELILEFGGKKFNLLYGLFEKRNEFITKDERFISNQGYKQVGKLLVPDREIINREVFEKRVLDSGTFFIDRRVYVKVLDNNPNVERFYNDGFNYIPVDNSKILVLNENQL